MLLVKKKSIVEGFGRPKESCNIVMILTSKSSAMKKKKRIIIENYH